MKDKMPLTWVVKSFSNGSAKIGSQDKIIDVPRFQLPENIKEGDILTAEFYRLKDEPKRKENLARALLEEILGEE